MESIGEGSLGSGKRAGTESKRQWPADCSLRFSIPTTSTHAHEDVSDDEDDDSRSLKLAMVQNPLHQSHGHATDQDDVSASCGNWKKRVYMRASFAESHSAIDDKPATFALPQSTLGKSNPAFHMQTNTETTRTGPETTVVRRHRRKPPTGVHLTCRVCGDDACGYNFDALTCHSCKLFFRRNAYRTLTCPFSGNCQMDKRSRKFCASCRLRKCFSVGMLRELIKLRYVQKNYHHRSASASASASTSAAVLDGAMQLQMKHEAAEDDAQHLDDARPNSRFTPPDTPDSVAEVDSSDEQPTQVITSAREVYQNTADSGTSTARMPISYASQPSASEQQFAPAERKRAVSLSISAHASAAHHTPDDNQLPSASNGCGDVSYQKRARMDDAQQSAFTVLPHEVAPPAPAQYTQRVLEALRNMLHGGAQQPAADSGVHSNMMVHPHSFIEQAVSRLSVTGSSNAEPLHRGFTEALAAVFARATAPSAYAHPSPFDDFGSPQSIAASVHSCSTASCACASSCLSPMSVGTRCSSSITAPRTRSVLSEYEYDTLLLQCHSCWHSLTQTMVDSDVFPHMSDKSALSLQCGPTKVTVQVRGSQYEHSYFELGVRRVIAALRLINDFNELSQETQMRLLKAALLSVLNILAVCMYDTDAQQWIIRLTREQYRGFSPADSALFFESNSVAEVVEYFNRLGAFHVTLRQRFADDHVPLLSMALIHLFEPARFADESPSFATQLRRLQHKHVSFLRKYIHRHYRTSAPASNSAPINASANGSRPSSNSEEQRSQVQSSGTTSTSSTSVSASRIDEPGSSSAHSGSTVHPKTLTSSNVAGDECCARAHLHFCLDQLNTTVRGLEQFAQRISNQLLAPSAASGGVPQK